MKIYHSLEEIQLDNAWLTMGSFDGVHLGHQQIIQNLAVAAHAQNTPAVALTFHPHPVAVLRPDKAPAMLTTPRDRTRLLAQAGADIVITYPFDQDFSARTAESFLQELKAQLNFSQFWVGHDFAMGRDRAGNIARLQQLAPKLDYTLKVIPAISGAAGIISSSRIRAALRAGDVALAADLLGRPHTLAGEVVMGAQRGRTIGIPTANVQIPAGMAVPATGVYACEVLVDGTTYAAATNIGVRPTFEREPVPIAIEPHILDFDQDIYGQTIQVTFIERLRGEQKFDGIEALIAQIHADIARTRELLG